MTDSPRTTGAAIAWGGLVAGTVDIAAASLINMIDPLVILRAIASGLLGRAAFAGGLPVSLLGLVLQWAMSLLIAAIFVLAAQRLAWMRQRWVAAGLAYGLVVFVVLVLIYVAIIGRKISRTEREVTELNDIAEKRGL